MLVIITCFTLLIFTSLLRGNKRTHSIIGIETCSTADWSLYFSFLLYSVFI